MSDRPHIIVSRERHGTITAYSYLRRDDGPEPGYRWTSDRKAAARFWRDEALRMAKHIRRQWKVPARVEAVS